ncbi:MAG: SDR family NAD(P)-dependent oxidoreductase [Ignavibacteriales bacterium]|nr:SDR family NAD(P)-dependent oxidoreductase [Ignavibacteriales bacterium]
MNKLKNKLTLITGATSGIGESCVRYFAEENSDFLLLARNMPKLLELQQEMQQKGLSVHVAVVDVRDKQAVKEMFEGLPEKFQKPDIIINSAGLASGFDFIQDSALDDIDVMIDTNVKGLLYITKQFIGGMMEKRQGHIINLGSIAGHDVYPKGAVYCASKFAVNALSKGFRFDLLEYGIRITSVDPGMVETNFSMIRFKGDAERAGNVYKGVTPLTADDIADAILYAATRAPHVNINEIVMTPLAQANVTTIIRK